MPPQVDLWIATTNSGKLKEFQSLLPLFKLRSLGEIQGYTPPAETGATFEENARIKAATLKSLKPGNWILADDSGLEVSALGGLPGIHSARYAGPKASDIENQLKLLKMLNLRAPKQRTARFICSLVGYKPSGEEFQFSGVVEGEIAKSSQGQGGFGYDPVFIPEGETKTFAELGAAKKNLLSHRARAIQKMCESLSSEMPS